MTAIECHNRRDLTVDPLSDCGIVASLIRDGDKLDIMTIATEYYEQRLGGKIGHKGIELDLPDTPTFSHDICRHILNNESVSYNSVSCLNDIKILQMGWVKELKFHRAVELTRQRGYVHRIRTTLPDDPLIDTVMENLEAHIVSITGAHSR